MDDFEPRKQQQSDLTAESTDASLLNSLPDSTADDAKVSTESTVVESNSIQLSTLASDATTDNADPVVINPDEIVRSDSSSSNVAKNGQATNGQAGTDDEINFDVNANSTTIKLSGQCLTTFPRHVLKYTKLLELDLPDNLLRRVPTDIRQLTHLVRLNLSHNPITCRSSTDFNGLPAELAMLPNLKILQLSECYLRYVPPVVWNCQKLVKLDLSRNFRLNVLPPEVSKLKRIRVLDVRSTGLSTVPDQIVFCRQLEELLLWGNPVDRLPDAIAYLPKLRRLAVDFRRFAQPPIIDDYTDGLLREGEFESGHIPEMLFEMPALIALNLDGTKINRLPGKIDCPLRELHLSQNYFRSIPMSVFCLDQLTVLDISRNQLTEIPAEIESLTCLKSFFADGNKIVEVCESIGQLAHLEELSLSENQITKLPNSIGSISGLLTLNVRRNMLAKLPTSISNLTCLQTLDLSDNRLTKLPADLCKLQQLDGVQTYRGLNRRGLWLCGNSVLDNPPPSIWKTAELKRIFDYLSVEASPPISTHSDAFNRRKLLVIGHTGSGKSSIVDAMILTSNLTSCAPSDLTDDKHSPYSQDRGLLRMLKWTTPKRRRQFLVTDFEGATNYEKISAVWPLFFADRAIYMIVCDYQRFSVETFNEHIGQWIDLAIRHFPQAVIQIVSIDHNREQLEADAVNGTSPDSDEKPVKTLIENCLSNYIIEKFPNAIDDDTRYDQEKSPDTQQRARSKSRTRPAVQKEVILVKKLGSGRFEISDMQQLIDRLEALSADRRLFPIPKTQRQSSTTAGSNMSWAKFKAALRRRLPPEHSDCYFDWNEITAIAADCQLSDVEVQQCLKHFHRTGEVLLFTGSRFGNAVRSVAELDATKLADWMVFPRPRRLVEILRPIFAENLLHRLQFANSLVLYETVARFTARQWTTAARALTERGFATERLLTCLWTSLANGVDDVYSLIEIVTRLGVGLRPVGRTPRRTAANSNKLTAALIIPCLNQAAAAAAATRPAVS